ncbi:DUF2510 domain-containing protein [Kitasatospora sp. NPDC092039]|uniref:DUF2510 domain-containing protein n=1 Tax=Kitasatospora sp. NPDC092039 TaxID=3364086 RepID=UPI00382A4D19
MSNSTPPGWYPVPGADGTPGHERWWDGSAWTSEVRPLQGGVAGGLADAPTQTWTSSDQRPGYGYPGSPAAPAYGYPGQNGSPAPAYGYPGQDGYQGQDAYQGQAQGGYPPQGPGYGYPGPGYPPPAPAAKPKTGLIIGIAVAVLAVGGTIAGVVFSGGGGDPKADPTPNPTVTVTGSASPTPRPSPTAPTSSPTAPKPLPVVKSTVPDAQHGITVPVFDGWEVSGNPPHSSVYLGTGRYTCPDGSTCIRGQFSVEKDTIQGSTPKAAADAQMPVYTGQIFSGVNSHTDAGSGYVSVAGVLGYATRWHIRTTDGTQGYVLLVALPAKGGGYVVMEGGVDDSPAAPEFSVLDQILKGIKQDSSSGSST